MVFLIDVSLTQGFAVTGQVTNPQGVPVNDVDMDVDDSFTGERGPTHSDHSNASGNFQFRVPAGTHDFLVLPPKASRCVATILSGVAVAGDTPLGQIQVAPGFMLSGHVAGSGGAPAADVDIDIIDAATGRLIPTVGDNTDAAGNYSVVVPAGTFTIEFDPLIGAGLTHNLLFGVSVAVDRLLDVDLPSTSVAVGIIRTGRLAPAGAAYPFSLTIRNTTGGAPQVDAQIFLREPLSGGIVTLIGPVTLPLPPNFGPVTAGLTLPIPADIPAEFRNRSIEIGFLVTDSPSGALLDFDLTRISIP